MAIDSEKLKQIEKLLKKIADSYKQLGESNPMEKFDSSKIKDADKEILKLTDTLAGVQTRVDKVNTSFGDLSSTLGAIVNEMTKGDDRVKKLNKGMRGLVKEAQELAYEEQGVNTLSEKQLETILLRAKKSRELAVSNARNLVDMGKQWTDVNGKVAKNTKQYQSLTEQQKAAIAIIEDEGGFQDELIKKTEARLAHEKKLNKQLGVGGGILEGLSKIPLISNVVDFPEIMKEARDVTEKTGSGVKGLGAGFKAMRKQAISGLLNPANLALGAITMLIAALKGADKEAGELSKEMGISYQEALNLSGEMNTVASTSGDIAVTQQGLIKSQKSLNEYFGQSAKFSGEIAEEFASIQKRTGLSDKAMGFFTKTAMKGGKDTKSILLNVNKTTLELNKQNKMSLSNKQVQEGIAKLSNTVKLNAKGNVEELTKAVFASKKLGASMAQIEQISSSLLDFESSIQNELQAELLLGKEINLESARAAALRGDQAAVAEEVMKNQAIMNAFETENVIAQEAAAKALGMSRNELADMVTEQQNLAILQKAFDGKGVENMADAQAEYNKLREEGMSAEEAGKKVGDESLANQLETISAAEKMENIMTRIQQLFMSLAEPILSFITPIIELLLPALQVVGGIVTGILDGFTWINEALGTSIPLMVTLGTLAYAVWAHNNKTLVLRTAIIAKQKTSNLLDFLGLGIQKKKNTSEKKGLLTGIADMAINAFNSVAKIPFIGPILGIAAAVSALALGMSYYQKAGDMSSTADGKTQVSTKEGGLFELSPNDDLVAAPGAVAKMNQKGGGGGGTQNNAALVARIDQLIATTQQVVNINQQILAKSPVIEMGGNEVGQGINTAEREIQ